MFKPARMDEDIIVHEDGIFGVDQTNNAAASLRGPQGFIEANDFERPLTRTLSDRRAQPDRITGVDIQKSNGHASITNDFINRRFRQLMPFPAGYDDSHL